LFPGNELYLNAYNDLDTERLKSDMSFGRIPGSKVREYAVFYGLDMDQLDTLSYIVRYLDSHFITKANERRMAQANKKK